MGVNKARAVGAYINKINPDINVCVFDEGITLDNAEEFVQGSNLLIDETEYTMAHIGVSLARAARSHNIPNLQVLNIGFGAQVTSYLPDGKTFEQQLGIKADASIEEIQQQKVSVMKWLARLPGYVDLDVFRDVADEKKSAPTVAPGVTIAAGFAATEAMLHLLPANNRRQPVVAPKAIHVDALDIGARVVRNPKRALLISLSKLALKNRLNQVPKMSY